MNARRRSLPAPLALALAALACSGGNGGTGPGASGGTATLLGMLGGTVFGGTLSVKAGASAAGATPVPTDGRVVIDGAAQPLVGGQFTR